MDAVDWTGLGALAALLVACIVNLSRQIHREVDQLRSEIIPRLDRIDERFIRHLETYASS